MTRAIVSSGFDGLTSADFRLLQEAARFGAVHVLLWTDDTIRAATGREPRFPLPERRYVIEAVRHVSRVEIVAPDLSADALSGPAAAAPGVWVVAERDDTPAKRAFCAAHGLAYRVLGAGDLAGFPLVPAVPSSSRCKKVIVTGCYDVFHSGHVRFFEEASAYGDLHVGVGNDANVGRLKGAGHPLIREDERRYMVASIRFVAAAFIASGHGWMDAEPEIARIKPDIYLVNEDGDRPEKREFCRLHGLEYVVLQRVPKAGLIRRSSTDLRGF